MVKTIAEQRAAIAKQSARLDGQEKLGKEVDRLSQLIVAKRKTMGVGGQQLVETCDPGTEWGALKLRAWRKLKKDAAGLGVKLAERRRHVASRHVGRTVRDYGEDSLPTTYPAHDECDLLISRLADK